MAYARKDVVHGGTFAELVTMGVRGVAHKSAALSWDEAGGLPLTGLTALRALDRLVGSATDTLLVHAGAGGVGALAIQIAKARGAKVLARQFNNSGVPAVELHGNLAQNARTRNLEAFHDGRASTLVVHADPPAEHKAYLHRSGRTARAGNAGTVVTIMTSEQVHDVRLLTRAAGIAPTTTRIQGATHPVLVELAPGARVLSGPIEVATPADSAPGPANAAKSRSRNRRRSQERSGGPKSAASGTSKSTGSNSPSTQVSGQKSASRRTPRRAPGRPSSQGRLTAAAFSSGRR